MLYRYQAICHPLSLSSRKGVGRAKRCWTKEHQMEAWEGTFSLFLFLESNRSILLLTARLQSRNHRKIQRLRGHYIDMIVWVYGCLGALVLGVSRQASAQFLALQSRILHCNLASCIKHPITHQTSMDITMLLFGVSQGCYGAYRGVKMVLKEC